MWYLEKLTDEENDLNHSECLTDNDNNMSKLLSEDAKKYIEHWKAKFTPEQKKGALIASLMYLQKENGGYLTTPIMEALADYLEITNIEVLEVATFYSMFDLKEVGKNKIYLCTNISCQLRGVDEIAKRFKDKLSVEFGETTEDKKFTLKEFECLGACTRAPMCLINETYHENLTVESVDKIIDDLREESQDDHE